jgi:hypothetical protein
VGVYMGEQSLLLSKEDYLSGAEGMKDDMFPLHLWIYFGFRETEGLRSGYTYGLKAFGKLELEIFDSERSYQGIQGFLFNMTHYVLERDVTFKDGETCGLSADEMIAIRLSPGKFVEGDSLKLDY